jgi:hypothetical protein
MIYLSVICLILSSLIALGNIGGSVAAWRRKKRGIDRGYSNVPLISLLFSYLAWLSARNTIGLWALLPTVLDPGTWMLISLPLLLKDWWQISLFTRILKLHGKKDVQTVELTLHSTGRYLLKKKWERRPNELGIVGLGELGAAVRTGTGFRLTADQGWIRDLEQGADGSFSVSECVADKTVLPDHSIGDWRLTK